VRWMSHGACRQADPELFFPIGAVAGPAARQVEAAKAVCAPCAVRVNCLSYALEVMPEGIWGGTTPKERRRARRRLFRLQANSQSPETISAAMTGESPTCPGHAADRQVQPGRTA
jgi:WhiB family redox-sensing transcriptional regulator